jgi:hypothetical protein
VRIAWYSLVNFTCVVCPIVFPRCETASSLYSGKRHKCVIMAEEKEATTFTFFKVYCTSIAVVRCSLTMLEFPFFKKNAWELHWKSHFFWLDNFKSGVACACECFAQNDRHCWSLSINSGKPSLIKQLSILILSLMW